ncbi:MAG TPA: ferritin-like domain-containing protein [Gemmatimonadaceae bacterium]|nr:ferritin-like domain-containing protein [Gemmatimonadaceae bacterium]
MAQNMRTTKSASSAERAGNSRAGTSVDSGATVHLGSGDLGILNYALALEQLEAEFYSRAVDAKPSGLDEEAMSILDDLRKHEAVHREFFFTALGNNAIPQLSFDFSSVDFTNGNSVLQAARNIEDLGVSAFNGAGQLLTNPDFLAVAGKIVSVEARHAAAIRDLLAPKTASFAGDDVVDASGREGARLPSEVLPLAAPFIKQRIDASQLPTM